MMMRQSMALPVAAFVTLFLFWGMHYLIRVDEIRPPEVIPAPHIIFGKLEKDTPINETDRVPTRPQDIDVPPPVPQPTPVTGETVGTGGLSASVPVLDEGVTLDGKGAAYGADSDVMLIVGVAPQYPRGPVTRGIEGWVEVEFTISKLGTVVNPVVVDHEPSGIFDRAVLKAVSQWKYNPKIVNGEPVERHGVRVVLTFELDK